VLYLREWRVTVAVVILTIAGATGVAVPISYVINQYSAFGIQLFFSSICVASLLLIPYLAIIKIDGLIRTFALFGLVLMVFGSASCVGQLSIDNGGGTLLMIGMFFLTMATGDEKFQLVIMPVFGVAAAFDYLAFARPYIAALLCLLLIAVAIRMLFYKNQKRLCVAVSVSILMMLPYFGSPVFGAHTAQLWNLLGLFTGAAGISISALIGYIKLGEMPDYDRAFRLLNKRTKCPQCGNKTPKFFWLCGFCGFELGPQPDGLDKVVEFDGHRPRPFRPLNIPE